MFKPVEYLRWATQFYGVVPFDLGRSGVYGPGAPRIDIQGDVEIPGAWQKLRQRIARYNGVTPDEVLPAFGTSHALWLAHTALLAVGDEVLIEDVGYEPLFRIAEGVGALVVRFERRFSVRFSLDPGSVARAIRPATRAVALTNPHNPSGVRSEDDVIRDIARVADAQGAYLLVDEVYAPFDELCDCDAVWGRSARRIMPNIVAVGGLSKCYGLGAHRIGWVLGPPEIIARGEDALMATMDRPPLSWMALALQAFERLANFSEWSRDSLRGKRERVEAWVAERPHLAWSAPTDGLFGFAVDTRTTSDFTARIEQGARSHGVVVAPGAFFGVANGFRLAWAIEADRLDEALRRLGRAIDRSSLPQNGIGSTIDLRMTFSTGRVPAAMKEEHEIGREAFSDDREYRLHCLRHSAAHLLAHAVSELFPEARFGIGPALKDGFYYDIAYPRPFTPEDLGAIEARMMEIVKRNLPLSRGEMSPQEATEFFRRKNQNFKVELIGTFPPGEPVGTYSQGDYVDLCRGPHIDRTGRLKHTKLLSVAGAYWRGDAKNEQLQRIYGTVFPTAEELKQHLERIELAKARDHRKLGRELGLFMFHEWAPGAAFWLPKGTTLYNVLAGKMRELLLSEGYVEVKTPLIFDKDLWVTSGHWEHYKEDIFLVPEKNEFLLQASGEKDQSPNQSESSRLMAVKPMNCPSHMLIFKSQKRSYRELPLRFHDQGILHRNELSGALAGLTRVRQFSQDDGHIFVAESEVGAEVGRLIALVRRVYDKLGMGVQVALSTRPDRYLGTIETWDRAETALKEAIISNGFPLKLKPKDGTFYGPKIDYQTVDALGRQFQTATLQLDFQLPQRFDLHYTGPDNEEHRPVVIHRAIYGSFERFIAILLEHFGGALPFWLSPIQIKVLSVGDQFVGYGQEVAAALSQAGLRVDSDFSDGTVGAKVRNAQMEKVPYSIVLGEREREGRSVTVRAYGKQEQAVLSLEAAVARFTEEARFSF